MNRYNIFNNKNKKLSSNSSFHLTEESFPKLAIESKLEKEETNGEMRKNISYVDKLNYMVEEENSKDDLKPGWIRLSLNRKENININNNEVNHDNDNDYEFTISSDEIKKRLQPMIDRWENYKMNYIELNGEDDYDFHHRFPNYDYSYLNIIEEEEDDSFDIALAIDLQEINDDFNNFY